MARKQDRQFSESDNLFSRGGDAPHSEGEERLPAWAQEMEAAADDTPALGSMPADEDDIPSAGDGGDAEDQAPVPHYVNRSGDEPEESDPSDAPDRQDRREEAAEAWRREATRVESSQERRDREMARAENEKSGSGKTRKPGAKKNSRKKKKKSKSDEKRSFLRTMMIVLICGLLFIMTGAMVASSFISSSWLALPRRIVSTVMTPVQRVFSGFTDSVAEYLRMLKIRGNLEYEYNQLLIKLDQMANDQAIMEELRYENLSLQSLAREQDAHKDLDPIGARVIGKVGNNYFSTLTLNVGSSQGVRDYMAVVSNGGLVGVTYNTKENECNVRCIIDSDCTVAGLVRSSRDQGSVKGTLGSTGEAMCRMYYLPDNSLPRPNDEVVTSGVGLEFPRGIPIGYVRESTRGMEDNKSYVVLEPVVDFQHLEFVTVYRYRPPYAESAQARTNASQNITLEPHETERPVPEFQQENASDFMGGTKAGPSDSPDSGESGVTAAPGATALPGATPTPKPDISGTQLPPTLEYVAVDMSGATPSPTPRPTFTPTPSPVPTPDPGALTVEDDE